MSALPIVLVTLAAGNIGKDLVPLLAKTGKFQVRAGLRSVEKGDIFKGLPNTEVVKLDDTEAASEAAFKGVWGVFLNVHVTHPDILSFPMWLKHAKLAKVQAMVYMSSAGSSLSNPILWNRTTYGFELAVRAAEFPFVTILRPTFFHQNVFLWLDMIKQGTVYASSKGGRFSTVNCRDIAAAAAKVFENPQEHNGKEYYLANGETFNDAEQVAVVSKAAGRKIDYVEIPVEELLKVMRSAGFPPLIVNDFGMMNTYMKAENVTANLKSDTLEKLLGRKGIAFEQYIQENANSFK